MEILQGEKGWDSVKRYTAGRMINGNMYVRTQGGNWIALSILIEMDREQGCHLQK